VKEPILKEELKKGLAQWLSPVILATREVTIKRILVQGQHRQKIGKTTTQQTRWA
jgi:hypothetical protein